MLRQKGARALSRMFDPDLASMGNRIASRRKELRMKASELAIQVGIIAQALSAIENGRSAANADTLTKICRVLKCSMADIQSESLDVYGAVPTDYLHLIRSLQSKPLKEQKMMLRMFDAQLATL